MNHKEFFLGSLRVWAIRRLLSLGLKQVNSEPFSITDVTSHSHESEKMQHAGIPSGDLGEIGIGENKIDETKRVYINFGLFTPSTIGRWSNFKLLMGGSTTPPLKHHYLLRNCSPFNPITGRFEINQWCVKQLSPCNLGSQKERPLKSLFLWVRGGE